MDLPTPKNPNVSPEFNSEKEAEKNTEQYPEQAPAAPPDQGIEEAALANPNYVASDQDTHVTHDPQSIPGSTTFSAPISAPIPLDDASSVQDDSDDNTPPIADDVDVIEQEWVAKAKDIIQETRDDPYRQEQEAEKLQISYLQKRYGKKIGSTD